MLLGTYYPNYENNLFNQDKIIVILVSSTITTVSQVFKPMADASKAWLLEK